eukprot:7951288-Alexandrium_andersonii.AAC.1
MQPGTGQRQPECSSGSRGDRRPRRDGASGGALPCGGQGACVPAASFLWEGPGARSPLRTTCSAS